MKKQISLMILMIALPVAGIIIFSGWEQRQYAIKEALADTQRLVDNISSEQENLVAGSRQLLSTLSQLSEVRSRNKDKVEELLGGILKLNRQYINIIIVDRTGAMWASGIQRKRSYAISVSDRRHFINARETRQFSSGEYVIAKFSGQPALGFGYPLHGKRGEFVGAIIVNFDLDYFRSLLMRARFSSDAGYLLVDHKGVIVGSDIKSTQLVGKQDRQENFGRMQEGPTTKSYKGVELDGVERFVSYKKLFFAGAQKPYLYVRAGIPAQPVVSRANRILALNLARLFPFMVISFFVGWQISKKCIIEPVAALQVASERMAGGDLQARVSLRGEGELGQLGRAFNGMAGRIEQDVAVLQNAKDELRSLAIELERRIEERTGELEALTAELNLSEERERRRIALALHDLVVQSLAIGRLRLDVALRKRELVDHPVLQELLSILETSMLDLRDLSLDLSPPILYDMGLRAAIANLGEKLEKKFGFRIILHTDCWHEEMLSENLKISLFQFCRELLMNTAKYAGAAIVTVLLHQEGNRLILSVDNDGVGFDMSNYHEGFGLANIRQRVHYLRGDFKIESTPGTGTRVMILIDINDEKRERTFANHHPFG